LKKLRPVAVSKNLLMDYDDASHVKEGEKVTMVKLGNVVIKSIKEVGDHLELTGEHLPDDNDFKST
jgi:pyruvate/2-oxoglutarate/acetoin dehydrogenase E1 component